MRYDVQSVASSHRTKEITVSQPICLQLYTVRDALSADWKQTLSQVAAIGYAGVELVYTDQIPAAEFKAELDRHNLIVSGAHVGIEFLRNSLDQVIDDLKLFGARYVICPWIAPDQRGDAAKWRAFMHEFEDIGARCQARDMQFLYHHHEFELESLGDTNALTILLDESKPGLIDLEIDMFWVAFAGMDPAAMITKYGKRVPCVHLKDMTSDRSFAEVGHGTLDVMGVIKAADAVGAEFLIVEQDSCQRDPMESIAMSYKWLKQNGR
jgi:sugar phosphate isomerase/epimerase